MKVKKISVAPIPATLQEMKFNASTPRQEALRLQANNTKEQEKMINILTSIILNFEYFSFW